MHSDPVADSDDSLAIRSRRGDAVAFTQLYARYADRLLRYLVRYVRDKDEAQDIMQECFMRIITGRGKYQGRGRFSAWLFTVATRLAIDKIRQTKRREELIQKNLNWREATPIDALETASRHLLLQRIEEALKSLPREHAIAFHLRLREGFSYAEMSIICTAPEGTLRSRVHHALRRLQDLLSTGKSTKGDSECPNNTHT